MMVTMSKMMMTVLILSAEKQEKSISDVSSATILAIVLVSGHLKNHKLTHTGELYRRTLEGAACHIRCKRLQHCKDSDSWQRNMLDYVALLLRGEVNISQLQGEIEFNTFLCDKPYN